MAVETMFLFVAPLIVGVIIGIIELIFVHADERGLGWLGHGLHTIPTCLIFTYISMNAHFVQNWLATVSGQTWLQATWLMFAIPLLIGIIGAGKVKAAASLVKNGQVGESWMHALVIGLLIAVAPFAWTYVLAPLVTSLGWQWALK
jgi:hypothetical protein